MNYFTEINSFEAHEGFILDFKHVSSSQIASCSEDKKIKLWNLETNECLRTFTGHTDNVNCLEISFDKSKLYSGSDDRTLKVWNISSGECLKTIDLESCIICLKLIPSDSLAVGLEVEKTEVNLSTVKIIDLNSFIIVKSLETESETVSCLNFNSDENILFTGSGKGPIRMYQF